MPILHAVVLGLVQGLTEFLPISSSGHLILVPWLFGWDDIESASVKKAFDVALHLGTLVAVVGYFRRDIVTYVREGTRLLWHRQRPIDVDGRIAWLLVLATVPAGIVGVVFGDWIDEQLGTPVIIALSLIGFGLLMAWADRRAGRRQLEELAARDAVFVGAAQALALNPGTSRSGITITAGRQLGFDRDAAARLSFLMSIPVIAGAVLVKGVELISEGVPDDLVAPMIVGIVTSGLSGWLAVWGTLRWVRTHDFTPFVIYRLAAGVLVLVIAATSWR